MSSAQEHCESAYEVLSYTHSVCPICLKTLPAERIRRHGENAIHLRRVCPEHGEYIGLIWEGTPAFDTWSRPKKPSKSVRRETETQLGCPHDCGRCPQHGQHACTVLFEITQQCNLRCPVCFADSGSQNGAPDSFPPLDMLVEQLHWIREHAGDIVLQISGGEPTLYPELPALVRVAKSLFPAVQLNTNGLRLAEQPELALQLAEAALNWVFLQFDGTSDDIYRTLRGKALLERKCATIENCRKAGLSVVLAPTVAAGVNDHDLGNLLRFALSHAPTVRGLHLQPMTGAGRNSLFAHSKTLTLPEVLTRICEQSQGLMRVEHAVPPGCEHERCSFHCRYRIDLDGTLVPLTGGQQCCCPSPGGDEALLGARRAITTIIRSWQAPGTCCAPSQADGTSEAASVPDAFSAFIAQARERSFSVTCMAFQDARNVDLERLQACCVHVYAAPDRLIPFCAYNLTSLDGTPLHRTKKESAHERP